MSIFSWFGQGRAAAEPAAATESVTQAAVTPEGAAHGLTWEMPAAGEHTPLLWPDASVAMEVGPLAWVSRDKGWNLHTGSEDTSGKYLFLKNAMRAAEADGVHYVAARETRPSPAIAQPAGALESYYARLADLAESRGTDTDRDAGRDGFDVER